MTDKELREIRRRFRPDKSNITNIRGCMVNENKEIISEINQQMATSSQEESEKLLAVMKKTLSGAIGTNLLDIAFSNEQVMGSAEHSLLMRLKNSELKDEEALGELFASIAESADIEGNYAILIAFDNYDVFGFSADGTKSMESEEVFSYMICCVCPLKNLNGALSFKDYDSSFHSVDATALLSAPSMGFMFPTFDDRRTNIYNALFYTRDISLGHDTFTEKIFNVQRLMPAAEQKENFDSCLKETLGDECNFEVIRSVHEEISEMIEEHKLANEEEPLKISKSKLKKVFENCGIENEKIESFGEKYDECFGDGAEINPKNIVDVKKFELSLPDVLVKVNPERRELVSTQIIGGVKYIMIRATEGVEVNGVNINIK